MSIGGLGGGVRIFAKCKMEGKGGGAYRRLLKDIHKRIDRIWQKKNTVINRIQKRNVKKKSFLRI